MDLFLPKVFSLTRVVMNVSQLAGPWVGGILYELDGFYLPFLVMGAIQVLNVVCVNELDGL
jgi:predicted MFS family arabinose efflux permease